MAQERQEGTFLSWGCLGNSGHLFMFTPRYSDPGPLEHKSEEPEQDRGQSQKPTGRERLIAGLSIWASGLAVAVDPRLTMSQKVRGIDKACSPKKPTTSVKR